MKAEELKLLNKRRLALKQKTQGQIVILTVLLFALAFVVVVADVVVDMNRDTIAISLSLVVIITSIFGIVVSLLEINRFLDWWLFGIIDFIKNRKAEKSEIKTPSRYKLLKLSVIFFSAKTQKEVFLPVMIDWDEEIYEALKKNKDASLFMINVRYTYAFLAAMWLKSPIGDLIQFVIKIAKQ